MMFLVTPLALHKSLVAPIVQAFCIFYGRIKGSFCTFHGRMTEFSVRLILISTAFIIKLA